MTLELQRLTVDVRGKRLVALDVRVEKGEILTLMAPSGAGKSTALAAIAGTSGAPFDRGGRVLLNGRDVTDAPTRARRIGVMFQDAVLFAHLSVAGNLGFALPFGTPDRRGKIARALEDAGLGGFADRDPATLSGGQRARVALLRTLMAEPQALLLDEPFSGLDADLRDVMRKFVFDRARNLGLPVVLVTHDADDARAAGGRVMSPLGSDVAV